MIAAGMLQDAMQYINTLKLVSLLQSVMDVATSMLHEQVQMLLALEPEFYQGCSLGAA